VSVELSRSELLSWGMKGGAAALTAGAGGGLFASSAGAQAVAPADLGDQAYLRLLILAELVSIDFYTQALATKQLDKQGRIDLKLALLNEQDHYQALSDELSGAGGVPLTAADVDFTYPPGSFSSRKSIVKLASTLEATIISVYVGAAGAIQSPALFGLLAQIVASEGEHLSAFSAQAGLSPVGDSFPPTLGIEQASDALDAYTS
jgi:hypothetical protein